MKDLAERIRCSQCKFSPGAGISVQPHPRLWVAHLRQSKAPKERLPFWAPMMRESEDEAILAAFSERGELP
jgi:hypothetical protein